MRKKNFRKLFTSAVFLIHLNVFSALHTEAQNLFWGSEKPLTSEKAFQIDYILKNPNEAIIRWKIKDFYYLYKEKFKFESDDFFINQVELPDPQIIEDPFFGKSPVYYNLVEVKVYLKPKTQKTTKGTLNVTYQGCWEGGVCYPSEKKSLNFTDL